MSKAALVSFAIDLKLTEQGEVKILEFGDLYLSGYSGYERLMLQSPVADLVFPFYERWGVPVYQAGQVREKGYMHPNTIDKKTNILPVKTKEAFDPDSISSYAAILTQPSFAEESQRKTLRQAPYDQVIVSNANALMNACFIDKAIMAAFGHKFAPDLFPRQIIYPVETGGRGDVGKILKDFGDVETAVLKNPWEANANGVDLLDMKSLRTAFNLHAGNFFLHWFKKPKLRYDTTCIVQDYVQGKLISAHDASGIENAYDPTMRVILTAWHENGQTFVKCHDAYYKIPKKPVNANRSRGSCISKVYEGKGPKSAHVPDEDKALTFAQLEEKLPAMIGPLLTTPSCDFVREFLQSDDEALKRIGCELAIDPKFFDRNDDTKVDYPEDIAALLYPLRDSVKSVRRVLDQNSARDDLPDLLRVALQSYAKKQGYKPKLSKAGLLASGLAAAIVGGLVLSGTLADSDKASKAMDDLFTTEAGQTIGGLKNLQLKSINNADSDAFKAGHLLGERAKAAGYELCRHGRWNDEAHRLFPAFKIAINAPEQKFVKVDINTTEHFEKDGVTVLDDMVTDTYIFGTKCPP